MKNKRDGWVYFVAALLNREMIAIKIGFEGESVLRRRRELQTGCPLSHRLLLSIWSTNWHESKLHRRFRNIRYRYRGEWFRPEPELLQHIEELRAAHPPLPAVPLKHVPVNLGRVT